MRSMYDDKEADKTGEARFSVTVEFDVTVEPGYVLNKEEGSE